MNVGETYILGVPPFNNQSLLNASNNDLLNMDAFLKMFTTQLAHQDPLNPMESYELASQLAQFSSVEQLVSANKYLDYNSKYLSSINNAHAVEFLGKDVQGYTDIITVSNGVPAELSYTLQDGGQVRINIYDQKGNMVRSLGVGSLDAGTYQIGWDGRDYYGNRLGDGDYKIEIQIVSRMGETSIMYPSARGYASGVKFISGLPYLVLDKDTDLKMPMGFVQEVYDNENENKETSKEVGNILTEGEK